MLNLPDVGLELVLELMEPVTERHLEALSVCRVSSAQARKHAAPSEVFQFAAAWSRTEPVAGTT